MYDIAICEDDTVLQRHMMQLCHMSLNEMEIEHTIAVFSSAEELEKTIEKGTAYDLLILDIILEGKSGMELAEDLRTKSNRVSIIFVTGAEEYLEEGYGVQPVHFLLKPISKKKLRKALEADWKMNHSPKNIALRFNGNTSVIPLSDIWYIEVSDHDVVVNMRQGTKRIRSSLSEMEELLPKQNFCRCHNSYLVNLEHIEEINRYSVTLKNNLKVPVGRRYYTEAQHKLIRYLNE